MEKSLYHINSLSRDEFNNNSEFYQSSFDEISLSQDLYIINWKEFFERHPVNSVVYLKENEKIVAFMYATPHKDYVCYNDKGLQHWSINYIQTHAYFEGKGYAYKVLLFGFVDMKRKGAKKVDFLPNEKSFSLFSRIVSDNQIGDLKNSIRTGSKTLTFNEGFINSKKLER